MVCCNCGEPSQQIVTAENGEVSLWCFSCLEKTASDREVRFSDWLYGRAIERAIVKFEGEYDWAVYKDHAKREIAFRAGAEWMANKIKKAI